MVDEQDSLSRFCKENAFNARKISTYLSIMIHVFDRDTNSASFTDSMTSSYDYFKSLLLKHSVSRPPKCIQVFSPDDSIKALSHTMEK